MTNEPRASNGLDPEMLAAYIDKRLPPDERAAVEEKLAADPESYELLVELIHANEALQGETPAASEVGEPAEPKEPQVRTGAVVPLVPKPARTRRWMIAGGLLAAAAAVVLVVRLQPDWLQRLRGGDAVDPQLAKLVAAVGEERYIEARLTGGFKYGPLRSVTRGPGDLSQQNLALLAAAGELQKKAQEEPTAPNLHAWGVSQLLLGDLDGAVESIERAVERETNARLQSDLSAALLARAGASGTAADVPKALEAAERALLANATEPAAHFNRALALEHLGLFNEARKAWEAALANDPSSPWREEIQRHLERQLPDPPRASWDSLRQGFLSASADDAQAAKAMAVAFPQYTRELVEESLLLDWAIEEPRNADGAEEQLRRAETLAVALVGSGGDTLPATIIADLRRADARRRAVIRDGARLFGEGRALFEAERVADAAAPLEAAVTKLVAGQSPLAAVAQFAAAQTRYFKGDFAGFDALAVPAMDALNQVDGAYGHRGQVRWGFGLLKAVQGDFVSAVAQYQSSLGDFNRVGELEYAANMHGLLAEAYAYLADPTAAWVERIQALSRLPEIRTPRRRQSLLVGASALAERQNLPSAAAYFLKEADAYLGTSARPATRTELLARQARLVSLAGDDYEGARLLAAARAELARVNQPGLVERLEAEILEADLRLSLVKGGVGGDGARVLDVIARHQMGARSPRVWMAVGELRWATGDVAAAEEAFENGLSATTRAPAPSSQPWRVALNDEAELLASRLASLRNASSRPRDAAAVILHARGRANGRAGIVEAIAPIDPGQALLVLSFGTSDVDSWVITAGAAAHEVVAMSPEKVLAAAGDCRRSVAALKGASASCSGLYDVMIRPHAPHLADVETLTISVPGGLLDLPFSALFNSASGRYLIEEVEVVVSGSTQRLRQTEPTPAPLRSVSVIGDPAFDRAAFPYFSRLPGARAEAKAIASLYVHQSVILDNAATAEAFGKAMATADVLHFAGHSLWNPSYPGLSALLMAGPASESLLYAYDLAIPPATITAKVVVLASCRSAGVARSWSASPLGLPQALLSAGVDTVIASTTEIPDDSLSQGLVTLHRRMASGQAPSRALALLQRESIRQQRMPAELTLQVYQ